jgi:hypothetical protein
MVKQQEQSKILNSQPPIKPISAMNTKLNSQPKDLTSSLIASNMHQLKTNNTMSTNNWPPPQQQQQHTMNNWQQQTTITSPTSQSAANSSSMNWNHHPAIMPSPVVANNQWSSSANNGNWNNAFDNLMPNKTTKVPMNQLQSLNQPLMPAMSNNVNNNNQTQNLLSADDIMNFLN